MRTYGMVCMASAALTVIAGLPHNWFGGLKPLVSAASPTRAIQGIVTGVGFIGAGVIMREGLNISGLTTAASIWASSIIGILCGAGFYFAPIMLTLVLATVMFFGGYLERVLPSRHSAALTLQFQANLIPDEVAIKALLHKLGYRVAEGSIAIMRNQEHQEWHFVILTLTNRTVSIPEIAAGLQDSEFLTSYRVTFARN